MNQRKHADLIRAWADGAVIEMKINGVWVKQDIPEWGEFQEFQVQVPKPWYRVALMKDGALGLVETDHDEVEAVSYQDFKRWLTPRIEYDAS